MNLLRPGLAAVMLSALAGAASAATLPCQLTPEDHEALNHARHGPVDISALTQDQAAKLCTTRRLVRDLKTLPYDEFRMRHTPDDYPVAGARFVTKEEGDRIANWIGDEIVRNASR